MYIYCKLTWQKSTSNHNLGLSDLPFRKRNSFDKRKEAAKAGSGSSSSAVRSAHLVRFSPADMTPALQMFAVIIAATLLQTATSSDVPDIIFTVAVSSQVRGGERETMCVQIHSPTETTVKVTLDVNSIPNLILKEKVDKDFYRCVEFQVPTVSRKTEAKITIGFEGKFSAVSKDTKIFISPPSVIHIVHTDKPTYKPGQTVHFRIVSIDDNFIPVKQEYKVVALQDPNSNRIAQWLDQHITGGILDLSHEMIPEAVEGTYKIIVTTDKEEKIEHSFTIQEYVLPKFEVKVELPSVISLLDREIPLKICGKYIYGKPVFGLIIAEVCRRVYPWYKRYIIHPEICKDFNLKTEKDGCATQAVKLTEFFPQKHNLYYQNTFEVNAEIEEKGTGVTLKSSGQSTFTTIIRKVTFLDESEAYKPGLPLEGKVKLTGPDDKPVSNEEVYLSANNKQSTTLTTDMQGLSAFSLDTTNWEGSVSLRASPREMKDAFFGDKIPSPQYSSGYRTVAEFYSKSHSFLKLMQVNGKISCDQPATVRAQYIIRGEELKEQKVLNFSVLVMSRGGIKQHSRVQKPVEAGAVNKGELSVSLSQVKNLAPYAQVVVYTVLPTGETVADSMDFPVELCLKNKVSLKFSSVKHLPAEKTTLSLKAHPGSLCSVRAIDKSVLLLEKEQELTVEYVFSKLPLQRLSGYEFRDTDPHRCPLPFEPQPQPLPRPEPEPRPLPILDRSIIYEPPNRKDDVYKTFKAIGMIILTNTDVTKPYLCKEPLHHLFGMFYVPAAPAALLQPLESIKMGGPQKEAKTTVRSFFPETWIWDLVPVGDSGSVNVEKTVPDTITKWSAGAFCVSSVGLGISPNIGLTAFKPFFVSLTLPYSVIRGEVLTLKATVFNYLSKCIMVRVKLAKSDQFTHTNCDGCQYSGCLCAEESRTFSWMVTPTDLGQVDLRVSAKAIRTKDLCGKERPIVPEKGRTDVVVRKLLVEAEGTPQMESHNALLCPKGKPVKKKISLILPEKFVEGSARASVIVLGDLMGGALKNLDNLLRMPYGCGEQNMLNFVPNIFILDYLKSTNQLTNEILTKTTHFLKSGYQRELNYKHTDGSYSAFGKRDASGNTWLTSFVMKSFGRAKPYIFVDDRHITEARRWLLRLQRPDGCIRSVGKLFHNGMKGGVSDDVSLTAYITAALLELDTNKVSDSVVQNCLKCLKTAVDGKMDNLYTTALMSYAFTLAGDEEMRTKLITQLHQKSILEGASRHWEKISVPIPQRFSWRRPASLDVEMTSYVLLALICGPSLPGFDIGYSVGIVRWLTQQQNQYGGFSSTQDTVVALQALAKYSAATYNKEGKTTVIVKSPGSRKKKFTVAQSNRLLYQEKKLSKVPGEYTVEAKGKSCVLVQFAMNYNIPPPPDFSTFSISTDTKAKCEASRPQFTLSVKVSYNGNREETNMVVINIKLLSGYVLDQDSLELLKKSSSVKRVDEEEGHINIYLDQLKQNKSEVYTVNQERDQPVGKLKPAVVKIYDYYQTSDEAATDYTSPCAE
uniref:alpha-2-macroglobulin-like protein 1 n=1 Tax=Semicossyphus pulcher TaxID=241346 RepID=UPI0037E9016A